MNAGKQFSSASPPADTIKVFLRDNGDDPQTYTRITVDSADGIVRLDTVDASFARVANSPRITLDLQDLADYAGTKKDAKFREFTYQDPNDDCATYRICVLCTEPEKVS